VVLVPCVVLPGVWIEQIVPGGQFKSQTSYAPNIRCVVVRGSQEDFDRAILARLDILREVMILKIGWKMAIQVRIQNWK
jgi:hypothetical protein